MWAMIVGLIFIALSIIGMVICIVDDEEGAGWCAGGLILFFSYN